MRVRLFTCRRGVQFQRGLSLIELMVALVLGLFLIAGMLSLVVRNSDMRSELDKAGRQIENGRYAVQRLSEDLRHAGFYGEFYGIPAPIASPADPCLKTLVAIRTAMSFPAQGITAASSSALSACSLDSANFVASSNVLVVRFASPQVTLSQNWAASDIATLNDGVLYMQPNVDGVVFATKANAATAFTLKVSSGTATNLVNAPVYRYITRIYFLSPCSRPASGTTCSAAADGGSPIPTLKMIELVSGGTAPAFSNPISVAEGIERLEFDYGIDTAPATNDGAADTYVDCSPCTATQWANVVAVRISLVARQARNGRLLGHATLVCAEDLPSLSVRHTELCDLYVRASTRRSVISTALEAAVFEHCKGSLLLGHVCCHQDGRETAILRRLTFAGWQEVFTRHCLERRGD